MRSKLKRSIKYCENTNKIMDYSFVSQASIKSLFKIIYNLLMNIVYYLTKINSTFNYNNIVELYNTYLCENKTYQIKLSLNYNLLIF